jgi:hypothetical protein
MTRSTRARVPVSGKSAEGTQTTEYRLDQRVRTIGPLARGRFRSCLSPSCTRASSGLSTVPDGRLIGYHPAMELTILGASGAWPAPGGAASGFLVRTGGYLKGALIPIVALTRGFPLAPFGRSGIRRLFP